MQLVFSGKISSSRRVLFKYFWKAKVLQKKWKVASSAGIYSHPSVWIHGTLLMALHFMGFVNQTRFNNIFLMQLLGNKILRFHLQGKQGKQCCCWAWLFPAGATEPLAQGSPLQSTRGAPSTGLALSTWSGWGRGFLQWSDSGVCKILELPS